MAKQLVAERDGVLVKVGNRLANLYEGGAVPEGADADHVKLLKDRGLLVEGADQGAPVENHSPDNDGPPAKSANKGDWVEYAVAQGADRDEAEASTKDDLIATYGG